jgi:pimeloyl-ACP methyl ester carboxylesterase
MYATLEIPTLYVIGSKDIIVDPVAGVEKLKSLGNNNIEIKVLEGLEHYLTTEPELILGKEMYDIDENASACMIKWILK